LELIEAYKYTHGLYKVTERLLEFETRTNTRGHGYKLKKLRCNFSTRQHVFSLRVTDMWNSLPDSIVDAPSMNVFKNRLDEAVQEHMFSLTCLAPYGPGNSPAAISINHHLWKDRVPKAGALVNQVTKNSKIGNRPWAYFFSANTSILFYSLTV
jgi:hypothetical protein